MRLSTGRSARWPIRRAGRWFRRWRAGRLRSATLAKPFEMALPSFLQHLRLLEDSGLVETRKIGRVRTCTLRPEALAAVEGWLTPSAACGASGSTSWTIWCST